MRGMTGRLRQHLRMLLHAITAMIAFMACIGCTSELKSEVTTTPVQQTAKPPGLVLVLPGIEGGKWSMMFACQGLRDAGVKAEIEVFEWGRVLGPLANLMDYEGNRKKAVDLAARLHTFRKDHPAAPIHIVGYSGGGGLAVLVAEALPDDVHVENLILAHAAISPDYDLTAALAHVDGKLINFHSYHDWALLDVGTRIFGTIDRKNVASTGKDGFDIEKAVPDPTQRAKIIQHAWDPTMTATGHPGGHFGMLTYGWNKRFVAPFLMSP